MTTFKPIWINLIDRSFERISCNSFLCFSSIEKLTFETISSWQWNVPDDRSESMDSLVLELIILPFFFPHSFRNTRARIGWQSTMLATAVGSLGRRWKRYSPSPSWVSLLSLQILCTPNLISTLPEWVNSNVVDAVCARFRISDTHWDDLFKCVFRRWLTRMLCDIRRKYKSQSMRQPEVRQDNEEALLQWSMQSFCF